MGVTFSSNIGDFEKNLRKSAATKVEDALAARLAEMAKSRGLTTADDIDLEVDSGDGEGLEIDEARVRSKANAIIRGAGTRSVVGDGDLDDDSGYGPDSYFGRAMQKDN